LKLYEITIKPMSLLGTPLKGDTLFGHFCWQAAQTPDLLNHGLDHWIKVYHEKPFLILSSAYPRFVDGVRSRYALKKPDLPASFFHAEKLPCREWAEKRKDLKKRTWVWVNQDLMLNLKYENLAKEESIKKLACTQATAEARDTIIMSGVEDLFKVETRSHNSINRLTQTTGNGAFAPFSTQVTSYYPETELVLFALLDEEALDIDRLLQGLSQIGQWGYGRDASTGLGRFDMGEWDDLEWPNPEQANACYTLGPSVPEPAMYARSFFKPFVRFGKHGDHLARSGNPFKKPVIMADEGAVFIPLSPSSFERPYLGRAVTGVSLVQPEAVTQGYSIYLPFYLEVGHA
jgi:CRISPR-associated protein Csm4